MIRTYPTYPQPIIPHPVTGLNWYLELTHGGTLRAGGTTTDAPTPLSRLRLVDPTGHAGYKIGLNSDATPVVTATPLDSARDGNYQDLSVWAINGREWNIRVTAGGTITATAIASDWPTLLRPQTDRAGHPIPSSLSGVFDGATWSLTVNEGGVMLTEGPSHHPITQGQRMNLLSNDGTVSYELAYITGGVLFTLGPNDAANAQHYDALLVSPSGLRFSLSVDANGVLFIDNGLEDIDAQNEWPLVMQSRSGILYVVDKRFPPPVPGGRGTGYGRRRG